MIIQTDHPLLSSPTPATFAPGRAGRWGRTVGCSALGARTRDLGQRSAAAGRPGRGRSVEVRRCSETRLCSRVVNEPDRRILQTTNCRLPQGQTERRHLEKYAAAELQPTPPRPSLFVRLRDKEGRAGRGRQLDDDVITNVS